MSRSIIVIPLAITAVTPDRSDGTDRDPVHVDMTVTCPT